jgi:hypothetical protein
MAVNTEKKQRVMPKGKPFVKGDPRINREGAPKRGQSWAEVWKRITDMTREELIAHIGANTKLGKMLKELPPDIPIKDSLAVMTLISYGREPNARMLAAIMDREDGKPIQAVDIKTTEPIELIVTYATKDKPTKSPS